MHSWSGDHGHPLPIYPRQIVRTDAIEAGLGQNHPEDEDGNRKANDDFTETFTAMHDNPLH